MQNPDGLVTSAGVPGVLRVGGRVSDTPVARPADPWEDAGYQPHEHGPHEPAGSAMPRCPWCGNRAGHELNTGRLGGLLCGNPRCGNHFTSAPGEYEAMASRRALWAEEIGEKPNERGDHE